MTFSPVHSATRCEPAAHSIPDSRPANDCTCASTVCGLKTAQPSLHAGNEVCKRGDLL